jgi:peptidoglycan/LPS O-acetylase OafA/YrhL
MMATVRDPRGHHPALDGIRGLAIALVFLYHCSTIQHDLFFACYPGWAGVDLFFVLSGLLITGLLLDAKGSPRYYRDFVVRRGLRIFPLYYATLAVLFIGIALVNSGNLKSLLPVQGYFWAYIPNLLFAFDGWPAPTMMLNHFWSLGVEEQFYLLWPLPVMLLGHRKLAWLCVAGILLSIALRAVHPVMPFAYVFTAARLDGLLLGALVAIGARYAPGQLAELRPWALGCGLLGIAAVLVRERSLDMATPTMMVIGYTAIGLLFAWLVSGTFVEDRTGDRLRTWLSVQLLRTLGRYAYGLYVFHNVLWWSLHLALVRKLAGVPGGALIAYLVFLVVLAALVVGSYHLYEKRFLALKDRWAPQQRTGPASSA